MFWMLSYQVHGTCVQFLAWVVDFLFPSWQQVHRKISNQLIQYPKQMNSLLQSHQQLNSIRRDSRTDESVRL